MKDAKLLKEHRIQNDVELQQTIAAVQGLKDALQNLRETILPQSQQWFDLMAEWPTAKIEQLEAEIADYQRRRRKAS